MEQDYVDRILEQWARERPDLDVSPIGVIGRVSRLSRVLEQVIEETFASLGLFKGGFDVLAALRRSGPPYRLSPTALHNSLLISSGAMTNRIDRLEERGLVSRGPVPNDRRAIFVGLTPKGKELVDRVTTALAAHEHELLRSMNDGERQELARLLRKVLISLGDSGESGYPMRSDKSMAQWEAQT